MMSAPEDAELCGHSRVSVPRWATPAGWKWGKGRGDRTTLALVLKKCSLEHNMRSRRTPTFDWDGTASRMDGSPGCGCGGRLAVFSSSKEGGARLKVLRPK